MGMSCFFIAFSSGTNGGLIDRWMQNMKEAHNAERKKII